MSKIRDRASSFFKSITTLSRKDPVEVIAEIPKEESILVKTTKPRVKEEGKTFAHLEERVTQTVPLSKLEKLYHLDFLTFRIVNDYIDSVVTNFILDGTKRTVKTLNKWSKDVRLKNRMRDVIRDNFLGGNGWVELGYTEDGKDIPKLQIINPNYMDYIRDMKTSYVKLDNKGEPIGYRKSRGMDFEAVKWTKDKIIVGNKTVQTFKDPQDGRDRIAHFALWGLGESYLGATPLEPVYRQAIIRLNISRNTGEAAFRSEGLIIRVGDEGGVGVTPTNDQLDEITEAFEDLSEQTIFAFKSSPKVEVNRMPVPDLGGRERLLYYYADAFCTGLGKPLCLIMEPLSRGRSTDIEAKAIEFEYRIESIQERLTEQIIEKLFYRYMDAKGIDRNTLTGMSFQTNQPTIKLAKARRIATLARRALIRYDPELEQHLRRLENLPYESLDKAIDEWKKTGSLPEPSKEQEVRVRPDRREES